MAKKDLIAQAEAKGIELTGDELVSDLEQLLKESTEQVVEESIEEPVSTVEPVIPTDETTVSEDVEEQKPVEFANIADEINASVNDVKRRHREWLYSIGK